jgi:hypothetical protein
MSFNDIELAKVKKVVGSYVESKRPPVAIRPELDIAYRVERQSIFVFEIRPKFRGEPGETHEHPVAKVTYVRTTNLWRLFWMRADLKWHGYEPYHYFKTLETFVKVIDEDAHGCFWG